MGFVQGFDFGHMSPAMGLGEVIGLLASAVGVIALFRKEGGRSRAVFGTIVGGFVAGFPFLFLLVLPVIGDAQVRCQVSITYNGQTMRRVSAATTREQAEREATESICMDLSQGITDAMQCQKSAPRKITCGQ